MNLAAETHVDRSIAMPNDFIQTNIIGTYVLLEESRVYWASLTGEKKDNFRFEIVDLYKTKGGLYYAEAYLQMLSDCMTEYLPDNITPRFYNRQIAAIRFVPKEFPTTKTKRYVNVLKNLYKFSMSLLYHKF